MILVHEVCFLVVVVVCVRMDNFGVMSVVNTIQLFVYFFTRALSLSFKHQRKSYIRMSFAAWKWAARRQRVHDSLFHRLLLLDDVI